MNQCVMTDKQRLDWLDSMSDGRCWVARQSTTGRGYRLHNESSGHKTVREAIDHAANMIQPVTPLSCSTMPSGKVSFHVWNQGDQPGSKCKCGKEVLK